MQMVTNVLSALLTFFIFTKAEEHLYGFEDSRDRCTSIGVARLATADGSTITTHNNDCVECDIRITHVPAQDWAPDAKRPVFDIRNAYPRYIEAEPLSVHGPDYRPELVDKSIYNWSLSKPIGYIDQVPHTYAYTLGSYALQNEKQVAIGESTCSSIFVAKPLGVAPDGKALLHMETLTEIALERCDTARCAIQLMGALAEQYGFYGPDWDNSILESAQDEAGEALTVSDANEVWMFHILPDDTGSSAIWVAQRVPDDHITAVANQFVITEIDVADIDNFLASDNIFEIAERNHLWSLVSGEPFNFARIYGNDRHSQGFACTRRVWRVFTLAAPSLLPFFSAYTDGMGTFGYGADLKAPYPFSVKVDQPLTLQQVMNINRDQFEGTEFDLTQGLDSGPFGDPMRYPPVGRRSDPIHGITYEQYQAGLGFQRPISLFRTAYSSITQSRASLPDLIGAVTWIAPYAPHHSSFVPVYANSPHTPPTVNTGTPYKLNRHSNWWIHCITGNYLSRWYRHTIGDVQNLQRSLEALLFSRQSEAEQQALTLLSSDREAAQNKITQFADSAAQEVLTQWWDFFFEIVARYRDLYKVIDPHAENFNNAFKALTVPRAWMESIGYWGVPGTPPPGESSPEPVKPINVPSLDSLEAYASKYPKGVTAPYSVSSVYVNSDGTSTTQPSSQEDTEPESTETLSPSPSPSLRPTAKQTQKESKYHHLLLVLAALSVGLVFGSIFSYYYFSRPPGYEPIR